MYRNKKILAIIPARSGSKGIKDKNIRELNGKPLISYTIEAAILSEVFDDVIVSTDSTVYADIARKYGANVPFIRSEELSGDEASTENVVIDVLERLRKLGKKYDYFVILQPTSPLRNHIHIKEAVNQLLNHNLTSVVSVCQVEHPIQICNVIHENLSLDNFLNKSDNKRRQELENYYRINGAIYIMKTEEYLNSRNFYNKNSQAYIMERSASVDIDEEIDFLFAQCIMAQNIKIL